LRIIGGEYRGRRITPPGNLPVRPTTDLAREALFNLLQTRVDLTESTVLDLFSGTGFVSYEFCSRGANRVIAVELHPKCVRFIRETGAMLKLENFEVIAGDVFRLLQHTRQIRADLIFADPPYQLAELPQIPDLIFGTDILNEGGFLILEHDRHHSFNQHIHFVEERNYGKVHFSIFQRQSL
jgi:16S rRNA (guanine966-N2)-methyltransferase